MIMSKDSSKIKVKTATTYEFWDLFVVLLVADFFGYGGDSL